MCCFFVVLFIFDGKKLKTKWLFWIFAILLLLLYLHQKENSSCVIIIYIVNMDVNNIQYIYINILFFCFESKWRKAFREFVCLVLQRNKMNNCIVVILSLSFETNKTRKWWIADKVKIWKKMSMSCFILFCMSCVLFVWLCLIMLICV